MGKLLKDTCCSIQRKANKIEGAGDYRLLEVNGFWTTEKVKKQLYQREICNLGVRGPPS